MSGFKPQNNKGKKPAYHSVPMKKSGVKPPAKSGSKYSAPKKKKLPTPVIVTNILMICVILSVCGLVFAIAYNNIRYDKADASAASKPIVSVNSGVQSVPPASSVNGSAVNAPQSAAVTSEDMPQSSTDNTSLSVEPPSGEFSAEFFKDDLFIGDSIFTGLYGYSYLEHRNVAAAVGYTAYGAQVNPFDENFYQGSAVEYAKNMQPKHIVIMLGTNGLSPQTDMDDFENGFRGLINTLKRDCSDSKICVISVPPITADSSGAAYSGITNTIIDNANSAIKKLCGELSVMYYDLNSVLKDSSGYFSAQYAEVDGMHFLGSTYPVLLSGVQKLFEQTD